MNNIVEFNKINNIERKPKKTVRFSDKKEIYLIMEKANEKK